MADPGELLGTYLGILPQAPEARVLRLLIEIGAQVVGASEGSLLVLDEEEGDLRFVMTVGSEESEKALAGQRVPLGKGITGLAASTLEVQIGAPTFKDVKQSERRESEQSEPEAVLAAPMTIGDRLVGVVTAVSFEEGKRFKSGDARLFAGLASIAGVVVDQKRRLDQLGAESAGAEPPKALGEVARLEREILGCIGRLVRDKPEALAHVAGMLASVESMMKPGESG